MTTKTKKTITHHCTVCGKKVRGDNVCAAHPNATIDSVASQAARALGRLGGASKSKAKTSAARANGAKGGRPKKAPSDRKQRAREAK